MIIVYLVLGFCIASFIFLVGMCFQRKKIKDELLSMLKMNSQNYLKYFVNMANKKDFKLKNDQFMNKQMSPHAGMASACQDYRAK